MSRDPATLADMLLAARTIRELVGRMDRAEFVADVRTRSAIGYQLCIIGEAVRRLSDGFKAAHPAVPWRRITAMRNWLAHQYDAVNWDAVWQAVDTDLPMLITLIEQALPAGE